MSKRMNFQFHPIVLILTQQKTFSIITSKKLNDDALENMITSESYDLFSERVKFTIEVYSIAEIDKIIKSKPKRIKKIQQRKGQHLRY